MAEVKLEEQLWEPVEHRLYSGVEHIKEEPELGIKHEVEEIPFHVVTVKTEDDEKSSVPPHRQDTNGAEENIDSSDTDCSEDYSQEQALTKQSYAMIAPDLSVTEHRLYSCSHCGKTFRRKSDLQRHSVVHTGERPHKCSICEKHFKQKCRLTEQIKIHTIDKNYHCCVCEKGFSGKCNLTRHLRAQHRTCPVCKKEIEDNFVLKEHLRTHGDDGTLNPDFPVTDHRPYSCSVCDKVFKWKSRLQSHIVVHSAYRPHTCSVCEKAYKHKFKLNEHMLSHSEERAHKCSACEKMFKHKSNLKEHMKTHTDENTDCGSTYEEDATGGKDGPYSCSELDKGFVTKSNLETRSLDPTREKDSQKVCTGENSYICSACDKVFQHKSTLVRHVKTHSGEKPFRCSVCEKCFTQKDSLKIHMRHHTGERPFICSVCEKDFSTHSAPGTCPSHLSSL